MKKTEKSAKFAITNKIIGKYKYETTNKSIHFSVYGNQRQYHYIHLIPYFKILNLDLKISSRGQV